jgi:DMSO/TMAO reductase YedYZ molybdopterin-dependent catalytic subunit
MPIIPTPPPMTLRQKIQTLQRINNMTPQNNVVQQITDLAREQAKIALDELMKLEQEKRKQTILTIENIDKIKGHKYSEWLEVGGVMESDTHYEFTLLDEKHSQVETILLHRRQTSDKRYIMEYNNQTLWITKDRLSTIEGIIECMREI